MPKDFDLIFAELMASSLSSISISDLSSDELENGTVKGNDSIRLGQPGNSHVLTVLPPLLPRRGLELTAEQLLESEFGLLPPIESTDSNAPGGPVPSESSHERDHAEDVGCSDVDDDLPSLASLFEESKRKPVVEASLQSTASSLTHSSVSSGRADNEGTKNSPFVIEDSEDEDAQLENQQTYAEYHPEFRRRNTPWSEEEREDLYLLRMVFPSLSWTDVVRILQEIYLKTRKAQAYKSQLDMWKAKRDPRNWMIHRKIQETMISGHIEEVFAKNLEIIRQTAKRIDIDLLEGVLKKRRREVSTDSSESPGSIPSSALSTPASSVNSSPRKRLKEAVHDHAEPKLPALLFRAVSDDSHGSHDISGCKAGAFATASVVEIEHMENMPAFDISLSQHIERQEIDGGSYFISTTQSLQWAISKALRMDDTRNPRILVIETGLLKQPVQHLAAIRNRLKAKGLVENIQRYRGAFEFLVFGEIPRETFTEFTLENLKDLVNQEPLFHEVLRLDILSQNSSTPLKRKNIRESFITDKQIVLTKFVQFVLQGRTSEDPLLQHYLTTLIQNDWEVLTRTMV